MPSFPLAPQAISNGETPSWLESPDGGEGSDATSSTPQRNTTSSATKKSHDDHSWFQNNEDTEATSNTSIMIAAPLGDGSSPSSNPDVETITSAAEVARTKTWGQYFRETFKRDGRLLLITVAILIVMNIPYLKWALYPFTIFSTWIHELCHGLAVIMAGGHLDSISIFPDTSGVTYMKYAFDWSSARVGFVVSAGYQGTAVIGCLLLLVRRTKRGPRTGTMTIALFMVISVALWIRNVFGIIFLSIMGLVLGGVAWKLPSTHMRNVYVCLAVTTCLNAITSVQVLFGSSHIVNGKPSSTDAHAMAELQGGTNTAWALLWMILALILTFIGILFAIPGPDQVADFVLCGVCQDVGCFRMCNFGGRRICHKVFSFCRGDNDTNATPSNSTIA